MTTLIFILILSLLVLIHEFGHFIVAKKNGIRVEEFGMGLPPKIWGKKFGETEYTLNALPFGGFVRLTGEDLSERDEDQEIKDLENDPRSFISKKPIQRLAVLCAGVFMNLVLAVTLFYIFFFSHNFKSFSMPMFFDHDFAFGKTYTNETIVMDIQKDSAAEKAGIELGESVVSVDDQEIKDVLDLRDTLSDKLGQEVTIGLKDLKNETANLQRTVTVIPQSDENGNVVLGVYLGKSVILSYEKPWEKATAGFLHSYNVLDYSLKAFAHIIGISVKTHDISPVSQSVSGPVGIYNAVGAILKYGGSSVLLTLMDYVALISLSFAFVNILPFPALDGGRALFVLVEWIRGKRINPVLEANIHKLGMLLLLGMLVLVTAKDIFI